VSCQFFNPFRFANGDKVVLEVKLRTDPIEAVGDWVVVEMDFTLHDNGNVEARDPQAQAALEAGGRQMISQSQIDLQIRRQWWTECNTNHRYCRLSTALRLIFENGNSIRFRVIYIQANRVVMQMVSTDLSL
jgi:hypothetical protein